MQKSIWLAPIACLLIALGDMPYGYYQILRILIFCVSIYLALGEHERGEQTWLWGFIVCAIIYNPVAKLALGRQIWPFVNIATILFFASHLWVRRRQT